MKTTIVKSLGVATLALAIATTGQTNAGAHMKGEQVKPAITLSMESQVHPLMKDVKLPYTYVSKPVQKKVSSAMTLEEDSPFHYVTAEYLNVRSKPNMSASIDDVLVKNWVVEIVDVLPNGWGKLKSGGYINLKYTGKYNQATGAQKFKEQSKKEKPKPHFEQPKSKVEFAVRSVKKQTQKTEDVVVQTRTSQRAHTLEVRDPQQKPQAVERVSNSRYQFSSYELDLFARIVRAESGDEPYSGQVAVASVILNRIDSQQFPNTVQGVVYQRNQFSPVTDGSINKPATDSTRRAVRDAINGNGRLYNAIYFYAPKYVQSAFMESRPTITQIGGHIFKR